MEAALFASYTRYGPTGYRGGGETHLVVINGTDAVFSSEAVGHC